MRSANPNYRLIDHTADFGIHAFGVDPSALFVNAAWAMIEQITDLNRIKASQSLAVAVDGVDWPDLMVNWLREVLYLWNGRQMLPDRITIEIIDERHLNAGLEVEPFDPGRHFIRQEIKAVTYHQIRVYPGARGWEAKIIFDV